MLRRPSLCRLLTTAVVAWTTAASAQLAPERWQSVALGAAAAGSHAWQAGALTVTSSGAGLNVKGADHGQFAYVDHPGGDFELVARLVSLTGETAVAGLMARSAAADSPAMTGVFLKTKDNALGWLSRGSQVQAGGLKLVQPAPLWLRLVRVGRLFAVYRSRDGRLWSMLSNVSGGQFAVEGPLRLGVFVAGGAATFDSVRLGPPAMRYRTSWVGNSCGSTPVDNHVSNGLSAMWVAPDGTCYTSSYWDEGGQPVASYRDGRVWRSLPIGTPQTAEGGLTGDGRRLYVAAANRLVELDPAAADWAPRRLALTLNLVDAKSRNSVVSGLAVSGRELFVADWRANLVRVVALDPPRGYQVATAANDDALVAPAPVVVPAGEPRLAPESVYQTQRGGEGVRYTVPGLTAGATYTVRGHFAEYVQRKPDCDPRNRYVVVGRQRVDVAAAAGGVLKPWVQDFAGYRATAEGQLRFEYGAYGGPGLCGFEVLDAAGARVFAINCGGPPVGDFRGEADELPARAFACERPGPLVADRRGELWIVQRGNDHPVGGGLSARYPAAVKCYRPDGTFTGRQVTDVVNPRCLAYDAAHDQLLVGENGPDLNVRCYGALATAPALVRTIGQHGGIYAGAHPGLLHDPAAGGAARFAGIAGLGLDAAGNLYVGGGFQGTDLRMFRPDGTLGWQLHSLMFCNTYDVDPDSDGTEVYGTYNHVHLDLAQTESGREQRYVGYNWDLRRFGEPDRAASSQSIVRRLGPERRLVMYTSGQGVLGNLKWFRYEGELAIPAGELRENGRDLWIDANGDGRSQAEEVTRMATAIGWTTGMCVDSRGDLWAASTGTGGSFMRHFGFKGCNVFGVPVYSGVAGAGYEDLRFPEEGDKTNGWGMASRLDYDADRDILIAFYPAVRRTGEGDRSPAQYFLARYDHWRAGNRRPTWKRRGLRPETDPQHFMYERDLYPYSGYMGLQLAGDYVFCAYLFGEVHVFDARTGELAEHLALGPEVNGQSAWEDAAMGLRAFRRRDGEYLIFTENSGWGGKNNLFRWRP